MHRAKHLFERVCSFENLRAAARKALPGKRSRMPGAAFFGDLEKELVSLHRELATGTYEHGGYHYFRVYEPKERLEAAAPFRDCPWSRPPSLATGTPARISVKVR